MGFTITPCMGFTITPTFPSHQRDTRTTSKEVEHAAAIAYDPSDVVRRVDGEGPRFRLQEAEAGCARLPETATHLPPRGGAGGPVDAGGVHDDRASWSRWRRG